MHFCYLLTHFRKKVVLFPGGYPPPAPLAHPKSLDFIEFQWKFNENQRFWRGGRGFFEDLASKIMNGQPAGARRTGRSSPDLARASWAWPSQPAGLKNLVSGSWSTALAMVMRGPHIFSILSKEGQIEVGRPFYTGPLTATKFPPKVNP